MSQPSPGESQPGPVPVMDTKLRGKRLYADPRVITFGHQSIELDQVEWVSYWAAHTATKRFLYPTTHHSEYHFEAGRYPYYSSQRLIVHEYIPGRRDAVPDSWIFLVNLSQHYLEPRLLTDLVTRVHQGETVTIGGSVKVNIHGVACPKPRFSLPWQAILPPQPHNGMIWIYQTGADKPLLTVPQSHPNASLIPALFAALKP